MSRNSGTRRIREDTQGHDQGANQVQEDIWGTRGDTEGHITAPVRDREAPGSNPGPPTKSEFSLVMSAQLGVLPPLYW